MDGALNISVTVRAPILLKCAWSFENAMSIAFCSKLYGGKTKNPISASHITLAASAFLCLARLPKITMTTTSSTGTKTCETQATKIFAPLYAKAISIISRSSRDSWEAVLDPAHTLFSYSYTASLDSNQSVHLEKSFPDRCLILFTFKSEAQCLWAPANRIRVRLEH